MFEAEARWLRGALERYPPERLSPLLNLGSSDATFRETTQPWIEREICRPLRARGVALVHVDQRAGPGIDVRADLTDAAALAPLRARRPRALLCCNLLEHVTAPAVLARRCLDLLDPGGLIFVTVPYSYPHHRDPIDTMLRPRPDELVPLFAGAALRDGRILGTGRSYRDDVRARPWLLLRHVARLPVPFLGLAKWRRSMARLYWLVAQYRVTCAVFEKL
jgi:Methyltransferase domain